MIRSYFGTLGLWMGRNREEGGSDGWGRFLFGCVHGWMGMVKMTSYDDGSYFGTLGRWMRRNREDRVIDGGRGIPYYGMCTYLLTQEITMMDDLGRISVDLGKSREDRVIDGRGMNCLLGSMFASSSG